MKKSLMVGLFLLTNAAGWTQEPMVEPPQSKFEAIVADVKSGARFVGKDIKDNTRFKVDSAISFAAVDWSRGSWSMGEAVPFLNIGSYGYLAIAASWRVKPLGVNQTTLVNGIRLNGVTRPLANKLFNALTLGNIDKTPLLERLANATAAGVMAGHDFNYTEKKDVAINTVGVWLGLEVAFGGPDLPKLEKDQPEGGIHFGKMYLR